VTPEPRWIAVGRIGRAHGVRGEVTVLPLTSVASRFEPGSVLFAAEDERERLTVASARPHLDRLLVHFDEVQDRDHAHALQGRYLLVPADSAPPLPEGEFWPHQLIGADVVTESGRSLGRIVDVVHTPANDIWVARDGPREVLIPALKDVVVSVDGEPLRRVVVREVPGLTVP
jgi:16S rRNA processing protein RimM